MNNNDERYLISSAAGDRALSSVSCDALADDLIALGFRRQGPITDAQVEAAWRAWYGIAPDVALMGKWISEARSRARDALEAAREVA